MNLPPLCKCGHTAFDHATREWHVCYFMRCACIAYDAAPAPAAPTEPRTVVIFAVPEVMTVRYAHKEAVAAAEALITSLESREAERAKAGA